MPSIILKRYAQPQTVSNTDLLNTSKPLDYFDWLKNNIGIIPNQAEEQYKNYLSDWYQQKNNSINFVEKNESLKNDYINLLKRLQIIFQDDEDFERITKIDFDSQTDLKIAIPYFARKLKEIALYFVNKRESIKKSKLRYNMIGSYNAVDRILREHLLDAFTKKKYSLTIPSLDLTNNIPELSSIKNDFKIEIEELYDITNYFHDISSGYGQYSLSSINPLLFVLEDYIFNFYNAIDLTEVPLSGLSNPLSEYVLCETDKNINIQNLAELGRKYIGNDVYFLTGGYYTWDIRDVSLDFKQGNNFFYWFSGETPFEISEGIYLSNDINSMDWTNATGASSYDLSDIIFISVGNLIVDGAWLSDTPTITIVDNMSATMSDGKMFKFPYPGYGLSAEDLGWNGKTITDIKEEQRKFFPNESSYQQVQQDIKNLYWSDHKSISSVKSIYLQNTTLANCGAFSSKKFAQADKVLVRRNVDNDKIHDIDKGKVFNGSFDVAWLYNFSQTELPIKSGTNSIYYPLTSYLNAEDLFFRYESGDDIALSSIDVGSAFAGAVAGNNIDESDMLLKLNSICGPEIEAAWLKGTPLSSYYVDLERCSCEGDYETFFTKWKFTKGVTQPGLSFVVNAGSFVRFVWTGTKTNINDIKDFTGFKHDPSCEYYKNGGQVSLLDTNFLNSGNKSETEKWKTCSCRAVKFTPMGHSGSSLMEYGYPTDFIAKDRQYPKEFSFNNWRGNDDKNYKESEDVAWFKLTNKLEPDVGWGEGLWQTNTNDSFYLEPGETYYYYRSNLNRCNFDLPYFVMNMGYCTCNINNCGVINCIPQWRKAILDDSGAWIDGEEISDMVMESGKFYEYRHKESFEFEKSVLTYNGETIYALSGDYVTLSSNDPNIDYLYNSTSTPSINFKIKIDLTNNHPYWGSASFDESDFTQSKRLMMGSPNYNELNDYLLISQPIPSNIYLSDNDVIEYRKGQCESCFVWDQPLSFIIQEPNRSWKKINIDNCVKSDIQNFLNEKSCEPCSILTNACYSSCQEIDICGCYDYCFAHKTSVTATNIDSTMKLNTELSGIPVFVNYFARNPYTFDFTVTNITNGMPPSGGLWVPPVSSIFAEAELPWRNLINDLNPIVAAEQTDNFLSLKELGLFTPERVSVGKYELKNARFNINYISRDETSFDLIRNETYADGDIVVDSVNSNWMKNKQGQNFAGIPFLNKHQTFVPYNNSFEQKGIESYGLILDDDSFSPWDSSKKWKYVDNIPANFRGLYPINCGPNSYYTNTINLSANVLQWQMDVFGNQFFLTNENTTRNNLLSSYNKLFIKTQDGKIIENDECISKLYQKYSHYQVEAI